jgi:asparagine synthase (glutamine-hydrolysing)
MCGIAGYFSSSEKFDRITLEKMTDALAHRGPDAAGYFVSEKQTAGFGHRRLSIIDLSTAANQPMVSHNGRYVMVFNGEVYNFKEIARQLNIQPKTTSDTEIILEAFALKGKECVHLFNGMFSIAIYDKQEDTLHLFRDRLGVKPLYYFSTGADFCFGSEIKALLQSDVVRNAVTINKAAVSSFLYSGYVAEPHTIYNQIKKLPAGSYAQVKGGEITIQPYWQPEEKVTATILHDFASAKKQLNDLLISSVQYRMISDVPFGTFLSGGIDSSTVTAIAQKISAKPINTFSISFKEAKYNEGEYARQVAKHLNTKHHEFTVTQSDALELMDKMLTAYDEPYADSSAIPTMLVSKLARQHVTMTLSGDGGDELFMGYGAYNWARRLSNPFVAALRSPIAFALSMLDNRFKRAAKVFDYTNAARIKSHIFSQEQYFFSEAELEELLIQPYRADILFDEDFSTVKRQLSAAEEQALFDIKYYLKDDLLTKVDIASMQFSLEARTPFLDYRVVEFALNLSQNLKVKDGNAKYLLKQVLYDYVPKEIFDRPKWGFSIPLVQWLKKELHYLIDNYLNNEVLESCGVVNASIVRDLVTRFEKGEDYLYNRLWALILLHKWMKEHAR